jgi:hypothetical protein
MDPSSLAANGVAAALRDKKFALLVAVLILAVIIIVWLVVKASKFDDDCIGGFYTADGTQFCTESEIASMMIFIGPAQRSVTGTRRQCYLVIVMDEGKLIDGFTLEYRRGLVRALNHGGKFNAAVKFDDAQLWPEDVVVDVDHKRGTFKVFAAGDAVGDAAGDVLYAEVFKNHDITNLTDQLADAELVEDSETAV